MKDIKTISGNYTVLTDVKQKAMKDDLFNELDTSFKGLYRLTLTVSVVTTLLIILKFVA